MRSPSVDRGPSRAAWRGVPDPEPPYARFRSRPTCPPTCAGQGASRLGVPYSRGRRRARTRCRTKTANGDRASRGSFGGAPVVCRRSAGGDRSREETLLVGRRDALARACPGRVRERGTGPRAFGSDRSARKGTRARAGTRAGRFRTPSSGAGPAQVSFRLAVRIEPRGGDGDRAAPGG